MSEKNARLLDAMRTWLAAMYADQPYSPADQHDIEILEAAIEAIEEPEPREVTTETQCDYPGLGWGFCPFHDCAYPKRTRTVSVSSWTPVATGAKGGAS